MLNSWKKLSNPLAMPKRVQDLDLSIGKFIFIHINVMKY